MSILDRMIARTRAALSPVEPILASRFESVGAAEQNTFAEVDAVRDRITPELAPAPMTFAPQRTQPEGTEMERGEIEKEQVTIGDVPPESVNTHRYRVSGVRAPSPVEQSVAGVHETASSVSLPRGRGVPAPIETGAVPAPDPIVPATTSALQSVSRQAQSVPQFERTLLQHQEPRVIKQRDTPPVAPTPTLPPQEIHINIGHIEVRTAPKPEPSRRPAPKPRVTLDDYLKRGNGDPR